jgi:hypothetical protein
VGVVDFLTRQLSELGLDSEVFTPQAGSTREPKTRKLVESWVGMVTRNPGLRDRFASGQMISLSPPILSARGETTQSSGLRLVKGDREALESIFFNHPGGASRILGKVYCNSKMITCSTVAGALRVTGLELVIVVHDNARDGEPGENSAVLHGMNPSQLPLAVVDLTELRMLKFAPFAALSLTPTITPAETCKFLQSIPKLEILELIVPLPKTCALPTLLSIVIIGGLPSDSNAHGGSPFADPEHNDDPDEHSAPEDVSAETIRDMQGDYMDILHNAISAFDRVLQPADLEFVCHSPKLQLFEVSRTTGLPACMARNTELLRVDMRGGRLRGPLPRELSAWTKLVDFVAFEQASRWCVPDDAGDRVGCKVNFHAKGAPDGQADVDQPLWHCPSSGWVVQFDDVANPWWGWRSVERFWVDVNFLHGSIPPELPDRWPKIRTLDLYSNELTGEVPASLCRLTQLKTLQLQDNNLDGEFPFDAFFRECPGAPAGHHSDVKDLVLSINPNLTGCVSADTLQRGAQSLSHMCLAYTKSHLVEKDTDCDHYSVHGYQNRYVRDDTIL